MEKRLFKYLFLCCLLLFFFPAHAQNKSGKTEDKKSVYSKLKSRSSQSTINDLLLEAKTLKDTSPQNALENVKEALAMSINEQDILSESRCYNLLGEINLSIEEWKLALENYNTAREKQDQSKAFNNGEYIQSLQGLGISNLRLGNYDAALKYFDEIKKYKISPQIRAETELNISEVYYALGKYNEALTALQSTGRSKVIDEGLYLKIENQKAKIYARLNQVEKASEILESSQNRSRASNAGNTIPEKKMEAAAMQSAKEELSDVYNEQKKYDEEISLRNSSIVYNYDVKNLSEVSKDKVELSKALVAKGETTEAIRELKEAAFIADTIGDPGRQAVAYLSLADLYERKGNPDAALSTFRKYSEAVAKRERDTEIKLMEKSELLKTQRDIEELSRYVTVSKQQEVLAQAMVSRQRLIIYGLMLIILITAVTSYFIYKNSVASKTANQLLALKSLRSQMNPHFIFNALNSVNHFVSSNDERTANKFLAEFSRLMRLVLENSQEDFIPLFKEEEIISLYLKLEHYRFRDKFDYEIIVEEDINKEIIEIPPMLIQPYIENAVWHGLRYKESKGFLSVHFKMQDDQLVVEITDNGIGRKRSGELKTDNQKKHQSTGLKNIRERLGIINKVYKSTYRVEIQDLPEDTGTKVQLYVPINHKIKSHA
jgi:tetratricopeptide (TPR) repeat protein